MALFPNIVKLLLLALSGVGSYFTWHLFINNGGSEMMSDNQNGPHILPFNDNAPLKKIYTGVRPIDYQLTVLTLFFYNIVDGTHPHASLHAYQFAGQLVAGWSLLMMESLRQGHRGRMISL